MSVRILVLILPVIAGAAFCDTREEIDHLLEFVAGTKCQYERNGTMHTGPEAKDHIQMKYEYYVDKINSAEDFIRYSATKSKLSGRPYKIHCPGSKVMNTSDWLLTELHDFRGNR
jgi:hypothetical protein